MDNALRLLRRLELVLNAAQDFNCFLSDYMNWILSAMGRSNIAIYLSRDDGTVELGTWMKYSHVSTATLVEELNAFVIENREEFFISLKGEDSVCVSEKINGCNLLAVRCSSRGRYLATVVIFRSTSYHIEEELILQQSQYIFSDVFARRIDEESKNSKPPSKPNSDYWWKRGDPPPF